MIPANNYLETSFSTIYSLIKYSIINENEENILSELLNKNNQLFSTKLKIIYKVFTKPSIAIPLLL